MQLPQRSRLQRDNRSRNGLADREIPRIDNTDGTTSTSRLLHGLLINMERIARITRQLSIRMIDLSITNSCIQDVRVGARCFVEDAGIDTETLSEDVLGGMCNPVIHVECGADGIEVAVVEGEEVFIFV